MKRGFGFLVLFVFSAGMLFGGGQEELTTEQTYEIRIATEPSKPDMTALLAERFAQEVTELSDDRLSVDLFLGGILGSQKALQEQVKLGTIETVVTASDIVEMDSGFGIFDFPFLFSGRDQVYDLLDGELGAALNESLLEKQGVRVLAFGELGFRQITNNVRPIVSPSDLEGIRLRVPPTQLRLQAFQALGASPTPIAWAELYQALSQNVVDGQENPLSAILGASFYEVQEYLSISNHVYTPSYLIVNEEWWQSLPEDVKGILQDAASNAVEWQRAYGRDQDSELVGELEDLGMTVNEIDHASFVQRARPVWDEFSDEVGPELVEIVTGSQ